MATFNRSNIMTEAHRQARLYACHGEYRKTFAWTRKAAWRKERALVAARAARIAAEATADAPIRAEIFEIETKDRMTAADFAKVASLRAQIGRHVAA